MTDETNQLEITDESKKMIVPYQEGFFASVPTKTTIYFRTNLVWQLIRFIYINIKMLIMIRKSHQGE